MDKARLRLADRFDCPLYAALAVIGGRWKPLILWHLLEDGPHRYLELQRKLSGVRKKVLTDQLNELQAAGLVEKRRFPGAVPHTEYRARRRAQTVRPVLDALCTWGEDHALTAFKQGRSETGSRRAAPSAAALANP